ncbi:MAG TPA: acyltransferase [Telluria sp.]|nr:acyltransferase [Telluria sp.]
MAAKPSSRLTAIDSLRGIAAMLVVLFHYTTRYDELYQHNAAPFFQLPWGHLGVNLFFMISGFVIFMTIEKTRHSLDFVVSRFSRLYPAYWAAILLTLALTHWLGLPGKLVDIAAATANLSMLHSFVNIPSVDGVYWTLEVELLFYFWIWLAYRLRLLGRVHLLLAALFALRLVYFWTETQMHVDLPWQPYRLLILKFIPWFAAGIMVYRLVSRHGTARCDLAIGCAAVVLLALTEGIATACLLLGLAGVLYAAARGHLALLTHPALVWLGSISYTLYLLHENIGWAIIRRLEMAGADASLAVVLALLLAMLLASGVTRMVELPAMAWLRARYRRRMLAREASLAVRER